VMSESAAPKLSDLALERIVREFADAGPDEQRLAVERIAERHGAEAAKEAGGRFAVGTAEREDRARAARSAREQMLSKLAAPKLEPAPEPEPSPQSEAKARPADASPVLNPGAPYDNASEFIHRTALIDGHCTLWFWQDQFYRWSGRVYEPVPHEVMRQQVYRFLDRARKRSGEQLLRFQLTPRHVNETIDALKSQLALGLECQPPIWLERREGAKDWVVFQNGIVNMLTEEVRPLTPDLWVHNALGFDWNADAECPAWETFLHKCFPMTPRAWTSPSSGWATA
jgi:putative DNA primase/helicase